MWNSLASLGSLVVPGSTEALPGLSQPEEDENSSSAKRVKISGPVEDFSLPPEMARAFVVEAARLQAMQAEILPYQPVAVESQSPVLCPPEPEKDRRMYVPSVSQSLTRRDIFNHFCAFGGLEKVCVNNGLDSLNYAIVIFVRTASMQLAIAANPHSIKGHRLFCRKAAEKNPNREIRQFVPTKPVRTLREETPVPQTLAAKPSEKILERNPLKPDVKELIDPKKPLGGTPGRLERSKSLYTKLKQNPTASKKSEARSIREETPMPQTLAAKPPEKILERNLGRPGVKEHIEPKKPLGGTPGRLERSKSLYTKLKQHPTASKKSLSPPKGDQTFVYGVSTLKNASRWRFDLARSFTSQEEKEALKDGHPSAAVKLLKASAHKSPNKSRHSSAKATNFIKPTTPLKTEGIRKTPSWIPASIPNSARIPVSLPPPSPRQALVSAQQNRISISKAGPKPVRTPQQINSISKANPAPSAVQPLNPVLHMPDINMISDISYFGPDLRYEHHCYTNVVAYQKTKLYIDLKFGELEKRQTIKEFIDAKYGARITNN